MHKLVTMLLPVEGDDNGDYSDLDYCAFTCSRAGFKSLNAQLDAFADCRDKLNTFKVEFYMPQGVSARFFNSVHLEALARDTEQWPGLAEILKRPDAEPGDGTHRWERDFLTRYDDEAERLADAASVAAGQTEWQVDNATLKAHNPCDFSPLGRYRWASGYVSAVDVSINDLDYMFSKSFTQKEEACSTHP